MSDQSPAKTIPDDTHCEYCGLPYETADRRDSPTDEPDPPTSAPAPRDPEPDEPGVPPLTHCEYCGLEYPEPPAGDAGPGRSSRSGPERRSTPSRRDDG